MNEMLLKLYQSILRYAGMDSDTDGNIYIAFSGDKTPITIQGEPFVFPTRKQLDDPNQKKYYFHPLVEQSNRGDSEVLELLKRGIFAQMNRVAAIVCQNLLSILGSPAEHSKLNEEQATLLMAVKNVDEKTVIHWSSDMTNILAPDSTHPLIQFYVKRAGKLNGQDYARVGVTKFPYYQKLTTADKPTKREKDKQSLITLLEYIFPGLQNPENYSFGTRSRIAPTLDAYMQTSALVAKRLNDMLDIFEPFIDDADSLRLDMDWFASFQDLDSFRDLINKTPDLRGNVGTSTVAERLHPAQAVKDTTPIQPTREAAPAPAQPVQQTYAQPAQPVVHQPAPEIRTNDEGKIRFGDVLRANPTMAMNYNPMAPQMYPPGYVPNGMPSSPMHQRVPGWAAPQPAMMMPNGYAPNMGQPTMVMTPNGPQYVNPAMAPQPMIMPGYQPNMQPMVPQAPPGYQAVWSPQANQYVIVPIQPQMNMNTANPNGGSMPPGWNWNNR